VTFTSVPPLAAGRNAVVISAVHWGEVAGVIFKGHGHEAMNRALSRLLSFGIEIVPVSAQRAVRAALIKVRRKILYADAFDVELASDSPEHVLLTADFDVKPAARDVKIEFLAGK
jgi:predicted nucleic acid-binding protein